MKIWNILLTIVTLSLALVTCRKDLTGLIEVDESVMKVSVLKEGASFAAVRVCIDTKTAAKDFSLQLNGEEVSVGQFSGLDTLVFIDSLVPATEYALRGNYWRKGQLAGISGEEKFTTLPLSSNDFTWRVDTVGAFPAQANDLAVIDENNVWAVGKFPRFFAENKAPNMVKWNGYDYEYHKIRIRALWSDSSWIDPLQTATAFSANDVWVFTLTGGYSRFDGTNWSTDRIPLESYKGNITKAWGFSSDDMYLIGTNGSITHYDGENFTLMESGTDADLRDLHGYKAKETEEKKLY